MVLVLAGMSMRASVIAESLGRTCLTRVVVFGTFEMTRVKT
jgi:hypothetical protein